MVQAQRTYTTHTHTLTHTLTNTHTHTHTHTNTCTHTHVHTQLCWTQRTDTPAPADTLYKPDTLGHTGHSTPRKYTHREQARLALENPPSRVASRPEPFSVQHPTHLANWAGVVRVGSLCLNNPDLVQKHPTHFASSVVVCFL